MIIRVFFYQDTCRVIDNYRDEKNQDILGNEPHIERAAGYEEHHPAEPVWQQIKQYHHNRKKNHIFYRIEKHVSVFLQKYQKLLLIL